jgi:hypothetical protein
VCRAIEDLRARATDEYEPRMTPAAAFGRR